MSIALLSTKIHIPPVRSELVPRPRLVEYLTTGVRGKLLLVSAPAGFGKTTLLSNWGAGYGQPLAWLWPILPWSAMGSRELHYNTNQIVFSVAHPVRYQLFIVWLAGVCVAFLPGAGFAAQKILGGQWAALGTWAVGALFIPSLALALGTWSGSSRMFEFLYLFLWYLGPLNQVLVFDYMGITNEAVAMGIPLCYAAITVLLMGLSVVGRRRQIYIIKQR